MAADMRLPTIRKAFALSGSSSGRNDLVVPGDVITSDTGFMRYGFITVYIYIDNLLINNNKKKGSEWLPTSQTAGGLLK